MSIVKIEDIYGNESGSLAQHKVTRGGRTIARWLPARPYALDGLAGLKRRLKAAWGVVTGRYDALDWTPRVPSEAEFEKYYAERNAK